MASNSQLKAPVVTLPTWAKWCLVKPCDGSQMFYMATYSQNDAVSQSICSSGVWEHCSAAQFSGLYSMNQFMNHTKNPPVAIDIGGNIGYYSLLLANAGWNVVTVEPLPMNTQLIEASLKQNPDLQSRVHIHKVGLSEKAGAQCAVISGNTNVGDGIMHCASTAAKLEDWISHKDLSPTDPNKYQLRGRFTMSTLDDVINQEPLLSSTTPGGIDFVKMDVEGFEGRVIKGGPSLLSTHKPSKIQSEVWARMQQTTPLDYVSTFAKAGYGVLNDHQSGSNWPCFAADDNASVKKKLDDAFAKEAKIINVRMCLATTAGAALIHRASNITSRMTKDLTVHNPNAHMHTLMRVESHGVIHKLHSK
jgi:FkbM family methyltransferase